MRALLILIAIAAVASLAAWAWKRTVRSSTARPDRASIMDAEPERMSLFSADHVRMLSDAQLRTIERGEEDGE